MPTTYYIDPSAANDSGSGLVGFPKKTWPAVLALAAAGDEIVAENGVFLNSVHGTISVVTGTNGLYTAPITIRARNEGSVIVDGEGSARPIFIYNTDWYIVQGFDVCRAPDNMETVALLSRGSVARRVVGWDSGNGNNDNCHVGRNSVTGNPTGYRNAVPASASEGNLIEDCAFFGTARYVCSSTQMNPGYTTWRRTLMVFDNCTASAGPNACTNPAYNSTYQRYENCILIMRGEGAYSSYFHGLSFAEGDAINWDAHSTMKGCLFIVRSGDVGIGDTIYMQFCYDMLLQDCVVWVAPEKGTSVNAGTFYSAHGTATNMQLTRLTTLGGNAPTFDANWTKTSCTDNRTSAYAAGFGGYPSGSDNLYVGSTGAKIRYRTVDDVLTGTELWPWPMNSRIMAAMTSARTRNDGRYTHTEVIDINTFIQSVFGSFPSNPITVTPSTPGAGVVGQVYTPSSFSASGGTGPYTYAVTAGALPGGISLASNGALSGTPTLAGTYNFTVTATDSLSATGQVAATMIVNAAPGAIAFRSSASAQSSATTLTITKPAGVADDDFLVCTIVATQVGAWAGSITPPAGWTSQDTRTPFSMRMQTFTKKAASEGANYAFTLPASTDSVGVISAYQNVDTTVPLDGVAPTGQSGASSGANVTAPTITSATINDMLVMAFGEQGGNFTYTPPAGMTERADAANTVGSFGWFSAVEHAELALGAPGATGAKVATASGTPGGDIAGQSLVLRAAVVTIPSVETPGKLRTGTNITLLRTVR